jgi:hypothetical protein
LGSIGGASTDSPRAAGATSKKAKAQIPAAQAVFDIRMLS